MRRPGRTIHAAGTAGRFARPARQHAAATVAAVALAEDHAPVGPHVDLQHLAGVGAGEDVQGRATRQALRRIEFDRLLAPSQVRQPGARVTWRAALLTARARCHGAITRPALHRPAAFALAPVHAQLQIVDLRLRQIQLTLQSRFVQPGLLMLPMQQVLQPLIAAHGACSDFRLRAGISSSMCSCLVSVTRCWEHSVGFASSGDAIAPTSHAAALIGNAELRKTATVCRASGGHRRDHRMFTGKLHLSTAAPSFSSTTSRPLIDS